MNALPRAYLHLDVKKGKSDGTIFYAIAVPGQTNPVKKTTGWRIPARFWDNIDMRVRMFHPEHELINDDIHPRLNSIREELKRMYRDKVPFTKETLRTLLEMRDVSGGDFIRFFREHIKFKAESARSDGYISHMNNVCDAFAEFAGHVLPFQMVNADLLERYELHLRKKGYEPGTIASKTRRVMQVVNRAIQKGFINPLTIGEYKPATPPSSKTPHLTLDQLNDLTHKLIDEGRYNADRSTQSVVAYFLLECYGGIRNSDWNRFDVRKYMNQEGLHVTAKKNKAFIYLPFDKFVSLKKVLDYISANDLKYTLTQQATNRILRIIGMDLKLPFNLSTHKGRHTFGTMLGEMGLNDNEIAQAMGISAKTAAVYVKRTAQGLKNAFDRVGGVY